MTHIKFLVGFSCVAFVKTDEFTMAGVGVEEVS